MSIRERFFKILFPNYYRQYKFLGNLVNLQNQGSNENKKIICEDRYKNVFEAIERDKVEVIAVRKNKEGE